jgi:GH43 family beta-xylosidase
VTVPQNIGWFTAHFIETGRIKGDEESLAKHNTTYDDTNQEIIILDQREKTMEQGANNWMILK